ncbi:MAG: zinc ribbon domain-containing protein [Coriobacteriales bacterium]|nr:zinc ribbon domain-containing protein [Coriobacteriales bacterium]
MGFLDKVGSAVSKTAAEAKETAKIMKLKGQLKDIARKRADATARLGADLYSATKDNPVWRAGRESIYEEIANLDLQAIEVQEMIVELEKDDEPAPAPAPEAAAEAPAAEPVVAAPVPSAAAKVCPNCGKAVADDTVFCTECGTKIQ